MTYTYLLSIINYNHKSLFIILRGGNKTINSFKKATIFSLIFVIIIQFSTFTCYAANNNLENQKSVSISLINGIKNSSKLNNSKYEITALDNNTNLNKNGKWIQCNSTDEIIKYLEKSELECEKLNNYTVESIEENNSNVNEYGIMPKVKSVTKKFSRGRTPKYTLKATFSYNTSTKKILSVKNRNFSLTGITAAVSARNKTYFTYYSSDRRKATVKCSYTAISYINTPWGKFEVSRHDAYQKFSFSVKKGVTDGKGGYE